IIERADPRRPVDRHRRGPLKQMRGDFTGVEARITRGCVFAELEHKLQRVDALLTIDRRLSTRIKHLRPECPENRHEISDRGIPARRSHNIAVDTPTTRGPGTLALVDR